MAEQLGKNFRVRRVVAGSPVTYVEVAGQTGLTRDVATNLINQSTKTSGKYGLQAPGRDDLTITVNGIRDLPDANGLEAVYAQRSADPQVAAVYQVVNIAPSPVAVVFQASMYVSNFSQDDPDEDNATYSFQLTLAAAPTIDDLTP